MTVVGVLRRVVWFLVLPLFIVAGLLYFSGVALEWTGDGIQRGADALRDELIRWGRVLFCLEPEKRR